MKKILIFVLLFFCFIVLNNSNNSYSFSVSNKVYKADNITLKTETGFSVSNGYLFGIEPERNVSDFDLGLDSTYTTSIFSESGSSKTSGYIFTGDKIQIKSSGTTVAEYTIVINGDNNGDGKISALDYIRIKNHIMEAGSITGSAFVYAGDYNDDDKISPLDYIKVKNYIMNRSTTTYSITYNANGGSGSVSKQDVIKDETTNVRRNTFTKNNSAFVSWNTAADGSGTSYNEVAKIKVTGNITLYAQWRVLGTEVNVTSFNLAYFKCGGTYTCTHTGNDARDDVKQLINDYNISIGGFQEAKDSYGGITSSKIDNISANTALTNKYVKQTGENNMNAILSKYAFISQTQYDVKGGRRIQHVQVVINGVTISMYNTHFALDSDDNAQNWQYLADKITADPNPVIVTGDFNHRPIDRYETYLKNLGVVIAAHDDINHNMNNGPHYMDSIFVRPYGSDQVKHIEILSSQTVDTFETTSDHNMLVARLSIY